MRFMISAAVLRIMDMAHKKQKQVQSCSRGLLAFKSEHSPLPPPSHDSVFGLYSGWKIVQFSLKLEFPPPFFRRTPVALVELALKEK
jgi:hypothetical protein